MKALYLFIFLSIADVTLAQDGEDCGCNEGLRLNKTWSITAGVGLRAPLGEVTAAVSYFLSPKTLVTFAISSVNGTIQEEADSKIDGKTAYISGFTTEVDGSATTASYKQFFSDSFYVEGGLDYSKLKGEYRISRDVLISSFSVTEDLGHYTRLSALVQIGNQWQWDNFTLGTSWVGLLLPLSHRDDFTIPASLEESSNSVKTFKDGAKNTMPVLLKFYLGWSF